MVVNSLVGYNNKKSSTLIKLNLDIRTLDSLCKYVLQPTTFVKMEHLVNLRNLLNILDPITYEPDYDKLQRINFIQKGLEARLENNINDIDLILMYINGGLTFKVEFLDYDHLQLSKDEIMFLHKFISESLEYRFIYERLDDIQDLCTRFKTSDFNSRGRIVEEFKSMNSYLTNSFRKTASVCDNFIDMTFSLRDGEFENAITNTWNTISNPSRRLICGMQGLNEMLGGGFESGRVYMLLGTSGVGKSLTLLNLIYQIKRFNKFYRTKDPTKTPCIVLLTMENTVIETITRLFAISVDDKSNMSNYTAQDCINMLRIQGELVLNDSSPIDIVIKYKANRSVDTSYLYTLYDDLEEQGYEMIGLVQDHVKRLRSVYNNADLRLELGDLVNELKVFAAEKDIPVITNSHLNRDASRTIEEATRKGNQDVGKLLGKSNIGESMLMIDNLDCGIIITLDFDKDQNRYMAFSLIKMRDKPQRTYIAQPFAQGSTIRLMEDYGGIPQFKETLHGAPELKSNVMKISGSSAISSALEDFDSQKYIKENNSFMSKSSYNLDDDDSIDDASEEFNNMLNSLGPSVPQPQLRKVISFNPNLILDDSYDLSKLNINWNV